MNGSFVPSINPRDRFLAACRRQDVDRPPVWLMRQAGRYLPEYRELREKYGFLEILRCPDLAVEVSLQPLRRFGMDAVIVFSDILIPAEAMGMKLSYDDKRGPAFDRRIEGAADVEGLARPNVRISLSFVLESLGMLKSELGGETALLGFVGGPWTLACYLVEGGGGDFAGAVGMARGRRNLLGHLLDHLTDVLVDFAVEQLRAGADAVQIFDTWGGLLEEGLYCELVLPRIVRICGAVRDAGGIPILFIRDSDRMLNAMRDSGAEVASLGSRTDLDEAWRVLGGGIATQGNLDPELLLGSPASVANACERLVKTIDGHSGHIVNLGHGVLPDTRPECVKAMVDAVKGCHGCLG